MESELGLTAFQTMSVSEKGYLFLVGNDQVYLFDGNDADPLDIDFTLPFKELNNLQERNGNLYLISNSQLLKYSNEKPIIKEKINDFIFIEEEIYLATDSGIKVYNQSTNIIYRPENLESLSQFIANDLYHSGNSVLIATNRGLYQYNLRQDRLIDISTSSNYDLKEIDVAYDNTVWSYDGNGSIYNIDLKTRRTEVYKNEGYRFTTLNIDSSDQIWFGSSNRGILKYETENDLWKAIDYSSGLIDNRVLKIVVDPWGETWIATADLSLSKYIDKDYELLNVYNGLPSDDVSAITGGESLLVSIGNQGIYQYIDGRFESVLKQNIRSEAIVRDSNSLWIGTSGDGVVYLTDNESTVFSTNAGLPGNWIHRLAIDSSGSIWIATPSQGLAKLSHRDSLGFRIEVYDGSKGIKDLNITCLSVHSSGALYYGTEFGNAGWIDIESSHNIALDNLITTEISDITEGTDGMIYFATLGSGIVSYSKNGTVEKLANFPDKIKSIAFHDGELFAANDRGVYTSETRFTVTDGFPSNNVIKSGMVVFSHRLYIGTANGVVSIGSLGSGTPSIQPMVYFENILVNYNSVLLNSATSEEGLVIKHNESPVSFEYKGVNLHSSRDLEYSYLLQGKDKFWSPWNENDNANYIDLGPGNYTFKVKARSDNEMESSAISFDFTIKGPFYNRWWFIALIGLLLSLIVLLIFKLRINQLRKKDEEEKARLELKNRLLELEQKANQLQMNPHFIFNALNSIQATVAKEDYGDARREISDFAILMRSILSNSKERMISLNDELKLLKKYISIEKKCRDLDFSFVLDVDKKLDQEEAMVPPMVIQPFVENAILHGVAHLQEGGLIQVHFALKNNTLACTISDNGIGRTKAKLIKSQIEQQHKSMALEVTQERLDILNPNLNGQKSLAFLDLVDAGGEAAGTKVVVRLPITL